MHSLSNLETPLVRDSSLDFIGLSVFDSFHFKPLLLNSLTLFSLCFFNQLLGQWIDAFLLVAANLSLVFLADLRNFIPKLFFVAGKEEV
jgi:hypothetical protein